MEYLFINTLSACKQCSTAAEVKKVVGCLVDCFKYIKPAIRSNRLKLVYDKMIENRALIDGEDFQKSIHSIDDADMRRLWYHFTRNRSTEASPDENLEIVLRSDEFPDEQIEGFLSSDLCVQNVNWLSLGGCQFTEQENIYFIKNDTRYNVNNFEALDNLLRLLPKYEASSKHNKTSYYDKQRNKHVSEMPLPDDEAQELLLISVEYENDLWAYHAPSDCYYRFKLTGKFKKIMTYHGYVVSEVPQNVLDIL